MKMFLLGVLVMWFILSYLYKFVSMSWGENVIGFPMAVCGVLFTILVSPFVLFWCIFLRHTIKPVTSEAVEKAKIMDYSGVEAINTIIEKYDALEKTVVLRNVGGYSHSLIKNAKDITSIKKETIESFS